jgi:hypothetical protein
MRRIFAAFAVALLTQAPAAVAQQNEVMRVINQFIDGFNKGDVKSAVATCAAQTSILDEFPPHEWHGPGACAKWAVDYAADAKKNGVTEGSVTLATPKHVDITGNLAYVVVPASYAVKQNGKAVNENGSFMTFALRKGAAGWRITGWTWTKN